jgi:maltose O-acetyltransferase
MSDLIHWLTANIIARILTRVALKLIWLVDRICSHLKFNALVKSDGRNACHWSVVLKFPENLNLGENVSIAPHCCIGAMNQIVIKDDVTVSYGAIIETSSYNVRKQIENPSQVANWHEYVSKPITIEEGVWIATGAIVLGGVTVGEHSIVGAGAIVTKDVPPNSIVSGKNVIHKYKA